MKRMVKKAWQAYLRMKDKARYARSFRRLANDPEMFALAEEGMPDYDAGLKEYENS